jgi:vacuolar-type H+-ATPase subunit C/Vma6
VEAARLIQCEEYSQLTASSHFFFSYSYMIDNIVLLITGHLHQRSIQELLPKCHPLGMFEQMGAITVADTSASLYNAILIDTPLGTIRLANRMSLGSNN